MPGSNAVFFPIQLKASIVFVSVCQVVSERSATLDGNQNLGFGRAHVIQVGAPWRSCASQN